LSLGIGGNKFNSNLGWIIGDLSVESELSVNLSAEEVDISNHVLAEQ